MANRSVVLLLAALAGACSGPVERDLEAVKAARTVLAEWALVEERAAQGETPATYVDQMRDAAREQLTTARDTFEEDGQEAAGVLDAVLAARPDAAALEQADKRLEPTETGLERS